MSEPPPIAFLDANVLANAILAESRIAEIRKEAGKVRGKNDLSKLEEQELKSYRPAQSAYALTRLLQAPHEPDFYAVTSDLALLEVTRVIVEEFKAKRLHQVHVPFRYWHSAQNDVELTKNDLRDIKKGILDYSSRTKHVIVRRNHYDVQAAETMVFEYGCDARDAILVVTAIESRCPIFVTEDDRLNRKLRTFKPIQIVKTQALVDRLKNLPIPSFYVGHPPPKKQE